MKKAIENESAGAGKKKAQAKPKTFSKSAILLSKDGEYTMFKDGQEYFVPTGDWDCPDYPSLTAVESGRIADEAILTMMGKVI